MHVQGNMIRPMSRDGIPYMVHLNHSVPLEMGAYNKSLSRKMLGRTTTKPDKKVENKTAYIKGHLISQEQRWFVALVRHL
jgi:hypothetical protein